MASIVSYHSHDYKPTDLTPVIASFDTEGHICPLYVRIHGESFKIDSFWVKYAFAHTIEFHCKIQDHGFLRPLVLTYYQSEGVWGIPPT